MVRLQALLLTNLTILTILTILICQLYHSYRKEGVGRIL